MTAKLDQVCVEPSQGVGGDRRRSYTSDSALARRVTVVGTITIARSSILMRTTRTCAAHYRWHFCREPRTSTSTKVAACPLVTAELHRRADLCAPQSSLDDCTVWHAHRPTMT